MQCNIMCGLAHFGLGAVNTDGHSKFSSLLVSLLCWELVDPD